MSSSNNWFYFYILSSPLEWVNEWMNEGIIDYFPCHRKRERERERKSEGDKIFHPSDVQKKAFNILDASLLETFEWNEFTNKSAHLALLCYCRLFYLVCARFILLNFFRVLRIPNNFCINPKCIDFLTQMKALNDTMLFVPRREIR